nr:immunoglobulin light chain junction region [Macaca mulatta]
YMIWHNNVVLF